MQESLIGIIVPVYKVEKYVAECVESILAQTYTNFRLILVDDGTPDNAGRICDEYAQKDSHITVIHQENAGVTRARARGVEEANDCEFIMFVDSDDSLPPDAIETLVSIMEPNNDIAFGRVFRYKSGEGEEERLERSLIKEYKLSHGKHRENMIQGIEAGLWAKLFRRSIITNDVFDIPRNIYMGEDIITSTRISFNNKQYVCATNKYVYKYRQRSDSIMHTFDEGVEYEEKFLEYLMRSIPMEKADRYSKYIVINKIRTFDYHFGWSTDIPKWRGNHFYNNLLKEIKEYKIKELFIERELITATNKNKRRLLILLKRVKNKLFGQNTLI